MQCSTSACILSRPPSSKGKERATHDTNSGPASPTLESATWSPLSYSTISINEDNDNDSGCSSRGSSVSTSSEGSFVFEELESQTDLISGSSVDNSQATSTRPFPSIVVGEHGIDVEPSKLGSGSDPRTQPDIQQQRLDIKYAGPASHRSRNFSDSPLPECTSIPPSPAYYAYLPFSPAVLSRKLETVIAMGLAEEVPSHASLSRPGTPPKSHQEADETLQRALDFARFHQNRQVIIGGREAAWQSEGLRALLAALEE